METNVAETCTSELVTDHRKAEKEAQEEKERLDDVLKELHLFHLHQDQDEDIKEEETKNENSILKPCFDPPGINFFVDKVDCIFSKDVKLDMIFNNLNCSNQTDSLDPYDDGKQFLIQYHCALKESGPKRRTFKRLFQTLFTQQTTEFLDGIFTILIEIASRTHKPSSLLKIAFDVFPSGVLNLGGRITMVCPNAASSAPSESLQESSNHFSLLPNLKCILNTLNYLCAKWNETNKESPFPVDQLDDLILLILAISQDPAVITSALLPSIQDLLGFILDFYPASEAGFQEKIQDLVERLGIYWDESFEGFCHHTAYFLTCNVLPPSRRGSHLKGSLAFYSLMCCLTPDDVEVVDFITVSHLYKYCHENVSVLKKANLFELLSIFRLIDAAIDRPVTDERDKDSLQRLQEMISTTPWSTTAKEDIYIKTKFEAFVKEITSSWQRLMSSLKISKKQPTMQSMLPKKTFQEDDYDDSIY